jgi:type IV secretory pathway protease TraF
MSFEATITVLKDFDGLNAQPVEVITRKIWSSGTRDRKGRPQPRRQFCSYKGETHVVFRLSESSYGVGGFCISTRSYL